MSRAIGWLSLLCVATLASRADAAPYTHAAVVTARRAGRNSSLRDAFTTAQGAHHGTGAGRPAFAIVSCVRGSSQPRLATHLLPSLNRTITHEERIAWRITLYLCIDEDDPMYLDQSSTANTTRIVPGIELRRVIWTRVPGVIPHGLTAEIAIAEGADYVHRTNDDTQ